jgi:hypothetical protein
MYIAYDVDNMNMASTVNRDFLDSEFQVLNDLIDSMRVDLLQTSILGPTRLGRFSFRNDHSVRSIDSEG